MKIKITYSLRGMYVRPGTDLPAHFDGVDGAKFVLCLREFEHQGQPESHLCCDIVCDVKPSAPAMETLLALKENGLLPKWMVDFDPLPKGAKPWFGQIIAELSDQLFTFIKQLRWVQNTAGGHRPFSVVGTFWSWDGDEWSYFPSEFDIKISRLRSIEACDAARVKMAEIVRNGVHEPISHDLMREAGELVSHSPRSALLVAFAALETGIKLQLNRMIPDASALIDKMPSPPLITLLQEVLPKTIEAKGLPADHFPLAKGAIDYLRKWVTQRNQVTHGLKHTVEADSVVEFILFAKDILYLLDHLNGQGWALAHLKSELWATNVSVCRSPSSYSTDKRLVRFRLGTVIRSQSSIRPTDSKRTFAASA